MHKYFLTSLISESTKDRQMELKQKFLLLSLSSIWTCLGQEKIKIGGV